MSAPIRFVQSWGVPIMMTGVYAVLMWSSDASNTGKAWMAIGLGFVLVVWWVFRLLTTQAALSRAVAVGDAARVLELTGKQLERRKIPSARAPLLVYRALAHELRGEWDLVQRTLAQLELDKVTPLQRPTWTVLSTATRIGALIETGKIAEARKLLDGELAPAAAKLDRRLHPSAFLYVTLAIGRVLAAEGTTKEARPVLQAVLDDIHAGGALRSLAHFYLARLESEPAAAARHKAEIVKLVPETATWIRSAS